MLQGGSKCHAKKLAPQKVVGWGAVVLWLPLSSAAWLC